MRHNGIQLGPNSPLLTKAGAKRLLAGKEKNVEAIGDRMMELLGFTSVHFSQARATRQTPGIPDRKYYRGKITLWWEAKTSEGRQSKAQRAFQEMAEAAGEHYVLGTDDDLKAWLIAQKIAMP